MILSRITHAVRTQNWFAVALEFLIVIAGVVIGFQVNAWNENRQDRAREQAIIGRLLDEFRDLEAAGDAYLARAEQQRRLLTLWLTAAEDAEPLDMTRLRTLVLDFYGAEDPARAAELANLPARDIYLDAIGGDLRPEASIVFQQLVASGDLSLIRSERLSNALTRRDIQRLQSEAQIERNVTSADFPMARSFLQPVFQSGSPEPVASLNRAMSDPDFAPGLRIFIGLRSFNSRWYGLVHDETLAVLAALEEEAAR